MNNEEIEKELKELSDGKAVVFRDPDFGSALIGIGTQNTGKNGTKYFAVYNHELMVLDLMKDGITAEEAEDYIGYNTYGVGGDNFPVIISLIGEEN